MTLKEKLEYSKYDMENIDFKSRLKISLDSIDELQYTITDKWLKEYKKEGLLKFNLVPVKRQNNLIGKYKTAILEITLINNKLIVLNPVFSITKLDFRIEFYLIDNPFDKNIIIKKHINENAFNWVFYKSLNPTQYYLFTKTEFENIITNWLYLMN